jgi:hypothetical protein
MAFPATGDLAYTWTFVRAVAAQVKSRTVDLRTRSAAGPVSRLSVINLTSYLADARATLVNAAATPGIGPYAQAQTNDPQLNIAAEFTAMIAAIDETITWIVANFPQDANGFLALYQWNGLTGRMTEASFSSAQLAQLRTRLDALSATIS